MSTDAKPRTKSNGHASDDTLATTILDSANQIWLAGLGAVGRAEEEGTRFFDQLVAVGQRVETRARDQVFRPFRAAERKADELRDTAAGAIGHVKLIIERRIARTLNALQIPTSRDVEALTQRVEELTVALDRMERRAAANRARTTTGRKKTAKPKSSRSTRRSTPRSTSAGRRAGSGQAGS